MHGKCICHMIIRVGVAICDTTLPKHITKIRHDTTPVQTQNINFEICYNKMNNSKTQLYGTITQIATPIFELA